MESRRQRPAERGRTSGKATLGLRLAVLATAGLVANPAARAEDKSGVSPSRLKLPKGPGSLEGVGENVSPELSMGLMSYGIPLELPAGRNGMGPSLRLSYSSGGGDSVVGFGWSLSVPSIERMTSKGLPHYTRDDLVAAGGGDELVVVQSAPDRVIYRARYEGGFVRYTWTVGSDGADGYWKAEYPDGKTAWFGATSAGVPVADARIQGPSGTFAWRLVEQHDPVDAANRVVYGWERSPSGYPYLRTIDWVERPGAGGFRYRVRVDYEDRPDTLSDARPGFDLRQDRRVATLALLHTGRPMKSWGLTYEDAGGLSRLTKVERFGTTGAEPFPVVFDFGYSNALGEAGDRSVAPYVAAVDTRAGLHFASGEADFLDINADGLPDILDTFGDLHHQFALNLGPTGAEGEVVFAPLADSVVPDIGSVKLSHPDVQPLDVDGDGDTDLLRATPDGGQMLRNDGTGDWGPLEDLGRLNLPDFGDGAGAQLRFFDADGDRRMDILLATGAVTDIYPNQTGPAGDPVFGEPVSAATPLGVGFGEGLQLADLNGDGLLDAAQLNDSGVRYRLNLGHGRFSNAWIPLADLPERLEPGAQLADLDGDALADVVLVAPGEVRVWRNMNGRSVAPLLRIGSNPGALAVEGLSGAELPRTLDGVRTRFADLNGNGSTDVVFIDASGRMTYLELFPVRANLLVSIQNGIGALTTLTYGDSTQHMLRGDWTTRLPNPTQTLDAIESTVESDGLRFAAVERQTFEYADGYYDSEERQFRGFQRVFARTDVGDDPSAEALESENLFDVGAPAPGDDPATRRYYKGLLVEKHTFAGAGDTRRLIESTASEYGDCGQLVGVPLRTRVPVRFICPMGTTRTVVEGTPASAVTTAESFEYDALGNRVRVVNAGIVARAEEVQGCAPCEGPAGAYGQACGPECLGDEKIEETSYVPPTFEGTGDRWMIRMPCEQRVSGREGSAMVARTRTFYDNLEAPCRLTRGLVTRTTARISAADSAEIATARNTYDAYGNVTETLDPNGNRRRFEYDADALLPVAEVAVIDSGDAPYELRMEVDYDGRLDQVVRSRDWVVVQDGVPTTPVFETRYTFDEFGRLTSTAYPDDREGAPTERYSYEVTAPTPRIIRRARSSLQSGEDIEEIQCFDGRGRSRGKINRIEGARYLASEVVRLNAQGKPAEAWQPFEMVGGGCPLPAANVLSTRTRYDGMGRPVEVTEPDAAEHGGLASVTRTVYRPLVAENYDENDTDPTNNRDFDTPSAVEIDGLGRTVRMTRIADRTAGPVPITLTYDELGHLRGYIDVEGHEKVQTYDLLGRLIEVRDPDTGRTAFEYDAAGNLLQAVDARGAVIRTEYDAANRAVASWREWASSGEDRESTEVRTHYDLGVHCLELGRECSNSAGRVARIEFPITGLDGESGFDEFGYDARGRAEVRLRGLADKRFRFESTYDSAGRVTSTTYPDAETLRIRYDGLGRAKQVDGYVLGTRYDTRGVMTEATLFNGVREQHTYDARLRETAYGTQGPFGEVTHRRIDRDRVGNLLAVTDLVPAALGAPSGTATFTHDALYRLISASLDAERAEVAERLDWQYDDLDRILAATSTRGGASPAHVGTYTYSRAQPNTVVSTEDDLGNVTRYTYDAAGFMQMNGPAQYRWDAAGRLLGVQRGNLEALRAGYGPSTERVVKREGAHLTWYPDPSFEVRDGVTTKYVSIGPRKVVKIERTDMQARWLSDVAPVRAGGAGMLAAAPDGEIDAADAWVAQAASAEPVFGAITDADDPDVLLSAVARRMVEPAATRTTGLHHDHLGSLLATTDATGRVIARIEHYPYGTVRWQSDASGDDYEYTGKEHDDAAGLTYFGARYLDARLGRWVSADPRFGQVDSNEVDQSTQRFRAMSCSPVVNLDSDGTTDAPKALTDVQDKVNAGVIKAGEDRLDAKKRPAEDYTKKALKKVPVIGGFVAELRDASKTIDDLHERYDSCAGATECELRALDELRGPQALRPIARALKEGGKIPTSVLTKATGSGIVDAASKLSEKLDDKARQLARMREQAVSTPVLGWKMGDDGVWRDWAGRSAADYAKLPAGHPAFFGR
jgi:RHS repeat-associated protein